MISTDPRIIAIIKSLHPREGGFVDDPDDAGGATKNGISLKYARSRGLVFDLDHDGDVDKNDIRLITDEISDNEFEQEFLIKPHFDKLPPVIMPFVFDFGVNSGPGTSAKGLQRVLNTYDGFNKLTVDGDCGPKTQRAAAFVVNRVGSNILKPLVDYRLTFVRDLCRRVPSQYKFLHGWENRIKSFLVNP